jgi:hypothetical protein
MIASFVRPCLAVAVSAALVACGKPVESKDELFGPVGGASAPAVMAQGSAFPLLGGTGEHDSSLPQPSIVVRGTHGGKATLSVNPVGLAVGLVGKGLLFDIEYDAYSVDGVNFLGGKVSVLANFDYQALWGEDPRLDFELALIGTVELRGAVSDEVRLHLKVKTNLAELIDRAGQMKLRLHGKITASKAVFEFTEEEVVLDWQALIQGG